MVAYRDKLNDLRHVSRFLPRRIFSRVMYEKAKFVKTGNQKRGVDRSR